ncbi:hypothetical protein ENUP19_0047G0088 [Entamoeba nuttalli]|uniref:DNA recombination and repair protein Rad51-like C-terminal domain-containing protein n=1 Tax=Entamoeba nuttalli TaxID=412467 RepID=A0ABQ0DB00_9EUKA
MNYITGNTRIEDERLKQYFSGKGCELLIKNHITTVNDFVKAPLSKFEGIITDLEQVKKLQLKFALQLISRSYTLKDWKDSITIHPITTGITAIDNALPDNGLVQGRFYDFIGNIDGPINHVIITIVCSFLVSTNGDVLWIDTLSHPDFDIVFDILNNQFGCTETDIINIYFTRIHVITIQSFYKLDNLFESIIKETKSQMVVINSLSQLIQGNLLMSSPLYQKTVQFLNRICSIAFSQQLIILNITFQQIVLYENQSPHLVETVLKNGYPSFPTMRIAIMSQDNQVSALLIKPQLLFKEDINE